jgi:MFS family permease
MSLPALFGLITSFVVGPLAMKVNKKWIMCFCAVLLVGYFALFSFASRSLTMLLVAAGLAGVAQGMTMTLTGAILGEFVGAANSSTYVAVSTAILNGGGVLMNIVGGRIAAGNAGADWFKAYYLGFAIIPALIFFFIFMPLKPEAAAEGPGGRPAGGPGGPGSDGGGKLPVRMYFISLLGILFSIALCGYLFNISVYIVNVYQLGTSVETGYVNSVFTAVGVLVGLSYAVWQKLFKNNLIFVGFFIASAGLLVLYLFHTLVGAFAAAVLIGFGFNLMNPWIMGFIMQICPPRLAAVGISFLMAGANLGMFVAPYVLNFVSNLLGAADPVAGMQSLLLFSVVLAFACSVGGLFVYSTKGTPLETKKA